MRYPEQTHMNPRGCLVGFLILSPIYLGVLYLLWKANS